MTKTNVLQKIYPLLFVAVIVLGFLLRVIPILSYNLPFTSDQGRDMLILREIVIGHHLTLVGPVTDVIGLYLGPTWFYFNVIPFVISRGDPSFLVYWLILWYLLMGFLWWRVYRKEDPVFALSSSLLFLLVPSYLYISRYSLNSNLLPVCLSFYFMLITSQIKQTSAKRSFFLGFVAGLCLQFEAAFSISLLPFSVIVFLINRQKIKDYLFLLFGFILTLIPQVIFELKHNFEMTKSLIDALSGKTPYLIDRFPLFISTYESHRTSFFTVIDGIFEVNALFSRLFFLFIFIFLWLRIRENIQKGQKLRDFNLAELYFFVCALFIILLFIGLLFYNHPLKSWFLDGLALPLLLLLSSFLSLIYKGILGKCLTLIIIILFILSSFTNQAKYLHIGKDYHSSDKSDLGNQLEAIDASYKMASGESFKAYNYTSSVYDFTYQYLYWWYGTKKYDYQPTSITYLDNVPEYIKDNQSYLTKTKPLIDSSPSLLIIEKEDQLQERRYGWLGNFVKLCLVDQIKLRSETIVQKRVNCNPGIKTTPSLI